MSETKHELLPKKGDVLYVWRVMRDNEWQPCLFKSVLPQYEAVAFPHQAKIRLSCACCKGTKRALLKHYLERYRAGRQTKSYPVIVFRPGSGVTGRSVEKYISAHSLVKMEFLEEIYF